jgi:hypothetical protein
MRCAPHDEDTGGFFVATFRKINHKTSPEASSGGVKVEEPQAKTEEDEEEAVVETGGDDEVPAAQDDDEMEAEASAMDESAAPASTPTPVTCTTSQEAQTQGPNLRGTSEYSIIEVEAFNAVSCNCIGFYFAMLSLAL